VAPAFTNITWKTYIVFGVFCAVMTIHIALTYPETQGKSLEEIDRLFESNVKPWRSNTIPSQFGERIAHVVQKQAAGWFSADAEVDGKWKDRVEHREDV